MPSSLPPSDPPGFLGGCRRPAIDPDNLTDSARLRLLRALNSCRESDQRMSSETPRAAFGCLALLTVCAAFWAAVWLVCEVL